MFAVLTDRSVAVVCKTPNFEGATTEEIHAVEADTKCGEKDYHTVLVTGYDLNYENTGSAAFRIKNTMGKPWGLKGHTWFIIGKYGSKLPLFDRVTQADVLTGGSVFGEKAKCCLQT